MEIRDENQIIQEEDCIVNPIALDEKYCPSATHGDYSPSCPWNAPGMSIHDFI